jgi:hypothetical protein
MQSYQLIMFLRFLNQGRWLLYAGSKSVYTRYSVKIYRPQFAGASIPLNLIYLPCIIKGWTNKYVVRENRALNQLGIERASKMRLACRGSSNDWTFEPRISMRYGCIYRRVNTLRYIWTAYIQFCTILFAIKRISCKKCWKLSLPLYKILLVPE